MGCDTYPTEFVYREECMVADDPVALAAYKRMDANLNAAEKQSGQPLFRDRIETLALFLESAKNAQNIGWEIDAETDLSDAKRIGQSVGVFK